MRFFWSEVMKIEEVASYLKLPMLIATGLARAGFLVSRQSLAISNAKQ